MTVIFGRMKLDAEKNRRSVVIHGRTLQGKKFEARIKHDDFEDLVKQGKIIVIE